MTGQARGWLIMAVFDAGVKAFVKGERKKILV
jgi:hypothetical protein